MGIDIESARFLLASRRSGVSFQRCATLGRQNYYLGEREAAGLLREYGVEPGARSEFLSRARTRFAEPFWELLGARELTTIDASDFEGASRVHDMNQPIPPDLKERFDAVCDLGTLEHVFDFPTAIRNCLAMVTTGGHFLACTPCNNYFGHGFYQFSPELFFRIFSAKNGFQVERMVAVEYGPRRRWFEVADPLALRTRVTLVNMFPVLLFVRARKTASVPVLVEPPQQSDYAAQWHDRPGGRGAAAAGSTPAAANDARRVGRTLLELAPRLVRAVETLLRTPFSQSCSFRNRLSFTRVKNKR